MLLRTPSAPLVSELAMNHELLRVGDLIYYRDMCNNWAWRVTELFEGGFESQDPETGAVEDRYFAQLQIGWEFDFVLMRKREAAEGVTFQRRNR